LEPKVPTYTVTFCHDNGSQYLVERDGKESWLPKIARTIVKSAEKAGDQMTVKIPEAVAKRCGLIPV
jgi:hypothetical protein